MGFAQNMSPEANTTISTETLREALLSPIEVKDEPKVSSPDPVEITHEDAGAETTVPEGTKLRVKPQGPLDSTLPSDPYGRRGKNAAQEATQEDLDNLRQEIKLLNI